MVKSGFFNSVGGDRVYDAEQMSALFAGIINDGIFMSQGTQMMVTANTGMTVVVGSGRAWFNNTWTVNDAPLVLTVPPSDVLLSRIDSVILEVNTLPETRMNSIKIISGVPGTVPVAPTLVDINGQHQYALAHILVPALATTLIQGNITNKVGTAATPFVTGILDTMNIDALIAQWESQWDAWVAQTEQDTEDWTTAKQNAFDSWILTNQTEFTNWFNAMKGQLTTDAAGNLQMQINAAAEVEFNRYYELVAKTTSITKNPTVITETSADMVATTTFAKADNVTTITTQLVPTTGLWKYTKTTVITKGTTTTIVASYVKTAK